MSDDYEEIDHLDFAPEINIERLGQILLEAGQRLKDEYPHIEAERRQCAATDFEYAVADGHLQFAQRQPDGELVRLFNIRLDSLLQSSSAGLVVFPDGRELELEFFTDLDAL